MNVLAVVTLVVFSCVNAWIVAAVARRVIGSPVGWLRSVAVSLAALFASNAVSNAMATSHGLISDDGSVDDIGPVIVLLVSVFAWSFVVVLGILLVVELIVPTGSIPGPVAVVRGWRSSHREFKRYVQIVLVVVRQGLGGALLNGARGRTVGNSRSFRSLRRSLEEGGVTFVKFGQMLSARRDVIPVGLAEELSALQTHTAPLPWSSIQSALRDGLATPIDEVFGSISPEPLASASVGQVHAATLITGEEVVVKIQRTGAREQVRTDMAIIRRLARRVERRAQWAASLRVGVLVDDFARSLDEEMDYRIELGNMANVAVAVGTSEVTMPVPYPDHSTSTVLIMSRLNGTAVGSAGKLLNGFDAATRRRLADTLFREVLRQILLAGVFHADLHPGNVQITEDGGIEILDFGSVGRLDESERLAVAGLLLSVAADDSIAATDAIVALLGEPQRFQRRTFERSIGQVIVRFRGGLSTGDSKQLFEVLIDLVSRSGFSVPGQVAGLFRTLTSVEGTLALIDPTFDLVQAAHTEGKHVMSAKLDRRVLALRVQAHALTLLPRLARLPGRLDTITRELESGEFAVKVKSFSESSEQVFVSTLVRQAVVTVISGACIIAGVLLLISSNATPAGTGIRTSEILGSGLGLIGAVLGIRALMFAFTSPRSGDRE